MVQYAEITDLDFTVEEMERNVARFKDQKSSDKAFIDTREHASADPRAGFPPGHDPL
jgi:hypothetical protein